MNFFFGINSSILNSKLTIPRFQNKNPTKKDYKVFQLGINNKRWKINNLDDQKIILSGYKTKFSNATHICYGYRFCNRRVWR